MIWVFWGLLISLLGGLWLMSMIARRGGGGRYGTPRPPFSRILWALGHSLGYTLWAMAPRFGFFRNETPSDPAEDYVRDHERDLEDWDDDGSK